jgi:tRNA dimethylallyltransferase
MQVYREIPKITNQERRLPADLVGIVSVADKWTVARHREKSDEIIESTDIPFVLDAGTGMYLNSILLDTDLAPEVPPEVRNKAQSLARNSLNPRRASRGIELDLTGATKRGSIWDGDLRYDTVLIYLRPDKTTLDSNISPRSRQLTLSGFEEAREIMDLDREGITPNDSVKESIGLKELTDHLNGNTSIEEAEQKICSRTRKLARRQIRWFDKLARTIESRTDLLIVEDLSNLDLKHILHDTMEG